MARSMLVAGNWKMNGSRSMARELAAGVAAAARESRHANVGVACIPPFPYLETVLDALGDSGVTLGAQDISPEANGAFTGEVSGAMLADFCCTYAIIGHSERREYHGEEAPLLRRKIDQARAIGLTPIICVGEPLPVRQRDGQQEFVRDQIDALLEELAGGEGEAAFEDCVLAYEPIWAIGTGEVATPEQAQSMIADIRTRLTELRPSWSERPVLYGGSVKAGNAAELIAQPDLDGFLVGGASLDPTGFATIIQATTAAATSRAS